MRWSARRGWRSVRNFLDKQRSPIFIQFLDCVWQLTKQMPEMFQFGHSLLKCIMYHVYSCRYGNFLMNCEAERHAAHAFQTTVSLWTDILQHQEKFFVEEYDHELSYRGVTTAKKIVDTMSDRRELLSLWPAYEENWRQAVPTVPLMGPPSRASAPPREFVDLENFSGGHVDEERNRSKSDAKKGGGITNISPSERRNSKGQLPPPLPSRKNPRPVP